MQKIGYIWLGLLLVMIGLIGCSEAASNAPNPVSTTEDNQTDESDDPHVTADEVSQEKRSDFGMRFVENGDHVVYLTHSDELYVYHHESEEEFLVHEDVAQFELYHDSIYYLATDGITSDLDIPLQSIYRTDVHTKENEAMLLGFEEDGAYMSPREFYLHEGGFIAYKQEVGFFYSNYWFDYTVTTMDFSFHTQMVTFEDEYDTVLNEIQWQEDEIYFLVDRINSFNDDGTAKIELHSFSLDDGQHVISTNAFPLPEQEFYNLRWEDITVHVEHDILSIYTDEKLTYQIDLITNEISPNQGILN